MDYLMFKILVTRIPGIGKAFDKVVKKKFEENYKSTVGVDILNKEVELKENRCSLHIWDVAWNMRFSKVFYTGTDGALIIFDLTNQESYEDSKRILEEIKKHIGYVPFVLIGDNVHLESEVNREDAREFARSEGGIYIETSPTSIDLLEKTIYELTRKIFEFKSPIDTLKNLLTTNPEIKAVAVVSVEGLPIASALPHSVDEFKIAAMAATLLSLAEKYIIEMKRGDFEQLYVKGSDGYLLVQLAGPNTVLIVSTTKYIRLGLLIEQKLKPARKAVQKIKSIMRRESLNKITIQRIYLIEIFSSDLLIISEIDGLPMIKEPILRYFELMGISTEFYDDLVDFSLRFE